MKRADPRWYYMVLALALLPAGVRALTWSSAPVHVLDSAAVAAGKTLFNHQWKPNDPLANGGDGLGPVFNANSCVACHIDPTPGGAGGQRHNVTIFTQLPTRQGEQKRQGVVHTQAVAARYLETLNKLSADLPVTSRPALARRNSGTDFDFDFIIPAHVQLSQRNTPALYGAKLIDEIPDRVILAEEKKQRLHWGLASPASDRLPVGRALRLPDGRVGKFGWKAQSGSLLEFVQAACANELGLGNPASAQPQPLGTNYMPVKLDLTNEQCQQMTAFIAALPRPIVGDAASVAARGKEIAAGAKATLAASPTIAEAGLRLFSTIGCAHCHTPDLGSVEGLYSDLLLHRMGRNLRGGGSYNGGSVVVAAGPEGFADEWRTPPLWGVADSAPYLHDGRAATLDEAIALHDGQGARSAQLFGALPEVQKTQLIGFLKTLRAPVEVR
ncbi:MAG: hypothetical protein L0Y72_29205 [Gemmataceae bacterium]|nr:hypothetical protein [Gemmataceae bacterium]MCI0743126.1 hypothetical protein [Gemmataceae bacterium]